MDWFAEGSADTLYTATTGGSLMSIDKSNGDVQWQYQRAALLPEAKGKPAVARDGTVFLEYYENIDKRHFSPSVLDVLHNNGTMKWSRNLTDEYVALLDPDRGVLVGDKVHSHLAEDDSILEVAQMKMLSVETGEVKWRWTSPEASDVKPLFFLEDDSVLVLLRTVKWGGEHYAEEGGASISLLRLSGEDGRTLWTVSSTGFNTVFEHSYVYLGRDKVYVNEWIGVDGMTELRAFDFDGNSLFSVPRLAETNCFGTPYPAESLPVFNADGDAFIVNQTCASTDLNRNLTQSVLAYSGANGSLLWQSSEFDFGVTNTWQTSLEMGQDGSTLIATCQKPHLSFASAIINGQVAWKSPINVNIDGLSHPITADDGTTYLLGYEEVIAVGSDGLEKWRYSDTAQKEAQLVLV